MNPLQPKLLFAILIFVFLAAEASPASAQENWFGELKWREVGPTATGGRVTDIAVDPENSHHIFVASAAGGLWETINNGTTWNCIFEKEATTTIGDVVLDPSDAKTIWIGTGEANNQRSSLWGDGVYKSTDGGETWKNMGLEKTQHIGRVIVDPSDSETVFVAALGNLYSPNPERGLYKTDDGGKSWKKVLYVNPDVGVVDVVLDPNDTDVIFAATYERRRLAWDFDGAGPDSAIYKSTDGGENWKKLGGGLPSGEIGRIGLDVFAKDSKIIYATVSNQNPAPAGSSQSRGRGGRIQAAANSDKSDDEKSKTEQAVMKFFGAPASEPDVVATALGITIDFTKDEVAITKIAAGSSAQRQGVRDGDRLVSAGGVLAENPKQLRDFFKGLKPGDQVEIVIQQDEASRKIQLAAPTVRAARQIGGEIYRSEDSGETWKKMNKTAAGGSPAYYYGQIRIDPEDDKRLYVLSVPVLVSTDGGKSFKSNGAPSVHVDHHAFWINPKNPKHLMLGNDGGFHISYDQSKTWDYVFNLPLAQFYAVSADMRRPYHVYGGLQDNGTWGGPSAGSVGRQDWYRISGGDGFYVQIDPNDHNIVISESQFGAIGRLDRSTGQRRSIRPPQSGEQANRYNWNSPILMSTHDPRVVYFAGNKLFKSFNRGDDWMTISPDLTTNDPTKTTGNVPHCTITTIAESTLDKNILMVGTDDGKVQLTTDAGTTWTDLSENFPYRPKNWWCSRVEFSHKDKGTAYASFTGYREDDFRAFVFKTTDSGETWTSIVSNLPAAPVNVIKQDPVNPTTLYVGTEFSAYVSLDDGGIWHELNTGLPRVSVQDLLVHPRDNDLIIGTHGRGIYIMDHIKPLQDFNPETAKADSHLFGIDDWTPTPRTSSNGFAGDRKRVVSGPQSGASIWYHFKDKVDAKTTSLTVLNSDGKEVGKLKIDDKAGLHRATFPASSSGGRGRRFQRRQPTPPGIYKAVLKVGEETQEQKFEIKSQ